MPTRFGPLPHRELTCRFCRVNLANHAEYSAHLNSAHREWVLRLFRSYEH